LHTVLEVKKEFPNTLLEGADPMNPWTRVVMLSLIPGVAVISAAQAQEKKIRREELPPAVEKTVAEQSKGATIHGFSTEVENGKRLYEAELTVNSHGKDISMDEEGRVVEVEEEVAMDSLPPAVKEGITKAAGAGTIIKVESLTKNGKLVAYEAAVKTGTKRSEIQVGPDGNKLAHPE
jgi:uncharacterized membrane protein YkoI